MNAERLNSVLAAVLADEEASKFVTLLQNVEATYTASVQSPGQPQADAFQDALKALRVASDNSRVVTLTPSRRKILVATGGADLVDGLAAKVDGIVAAGPTPADVVAALQEIRTSVQAFVKAATNARGALERLHVAEEEAPREGAEMELLLPNSLLEGSLGGLAKELKQLSRALGYVVEAATGKHEPLELRSLGSGSAEFYIIIDPAGGLAILTLITGIVQLVNSLLQARKSARELEQQNAPKDLLAGLKEWEDRRIEAGLAEIKAELLASHPGGKREGRPNELSNALDWALPLLAERIINRGLEIDVAVAEPPQAQAEAEPAKQTGQQKAIETIREKSGAILALDRGPAPVLEITLPPAPKDEEASPESTPTQAEKQRKK